MLHFYIQYDLLNFIYEKYRQGEQILKKDRDRVKIENQRHLLSGVNETKQIKRVNNKTRIEIIK